ncbi:MAG: hypothetical protein HDQ88_11865 [Clostridia bacterium]|nr:hypothetical protein [Clostridia bacterium]
MDKNEKKAFDDTMAHTNVPRDLKDQIKKDIESGKIKGTIHEDGSVELG